MEDDQRKLVAELKEILEEFKSLDGDYHKVDREYMRLLKGMEKIALKIHNDTIKEVGRKDKELEDIIKNLRLKNTWMTFHSFRI